MKNIFLWKIYKKKNVVKKFIFDKIFIYWSPPSQSHSPSPSHYPYYLSLPLLLVLIDSFSHFPAPRAHPMLWLAHTHILAIWLVGDVYSGEIFPGWLHLVKPLILIGQNLPRGARPSQCILIGPAGGYSPRRLPPPLALSRANRGAAKKVTGFFAYFIRAGRKLAKTGKKQLFVIILDQWATPAVGRRRPLLKGMWSIGY